MQAIRRYAGGFKSTFGVNIHNSMSLPGLAESLVYKFYGDNCAPIYSFADNFAWINKEIRNNLIGGMVMVFKRLIDLGPVDDKYPRAAFYAANGEKYKYLDFQDFNSLYPWAIQSDLPCGPGIVFTKSGSKFKMVSMNSSGKKPRKNVLNGSCLSKRDVQIRIWLFTIFIQRVRKRLQVFMSTDIANYWMKTEIYIGSFTNIMVSLRDLPDLNNFKS